MVNKIYNLSSLKSDNYERFFEADGGSFLFSSIYAEAYKDFNIVILNNKGLLSVYLSKKSTAKSREAGYKLLSNKTTFEVYSRGFFDYLNRANDLFKGIIDKPSLDNTDVELFFNNVFLFYKFYAKTECFYTDKVYLANINDASLKKRLIKLENLKTEGRGLLINIYNTQESYLSKLLNKIFQQTKIGKKKLYLYHYKELERSLSKKHINVNLNSRKKNYLLSSGNGRELFIINNEFKKISNTYKVIHSKIFCGTSASSGRVIGNAYVLDANFKNFDHLNKRINEMKVGDILVTETTSPDLIFACKKAAAIITNQGGLGSHAAIISRELHIPCIVGTQNATKFIKTGDKILVDAQKGIVKIF